MRSNYIAILGRKSTHPGRIAPNLPTLAAGLPVGPWHSTQRLGVGL